MNACDRIREDIPDYLTCDLDEAGRREVQEHIALCPDCRGELEEVAAMWSRLGLLPNAQPSGRLRAGFYAMLEDARKEIDRAAAPPAAAGPRFAERLRTWFALRRPAFAAAFGLTLLAAGIGAGWFLRGGGGPGAPGSDSIAGLRDEVQDMRQILAVSLLDRPSATDRLQGVSYSTRVRTPDARTLDALIDALQTDQNVNVRLAAVDALFLFRNEPGVRESLVHALTVQESPLVQSALIDLLVAIRETRAVEALKSLIGTDGVPVEIKEKAKIGLDELV